MIANLVTGSRIIFSLLMLPLPVYSIWFYACYLLAGVTDMIDGTFARKQGTDSEFGEKLDTVADTILVAAAVYKLLPVIDDIGMSIWIWAGCIALIKVINVIYGFVTQKKLVAVHSLANKITGLALYFIPFLCHIIDVKYWAFAVCMLATYAAIHEGCVIRNKKHAI